MSIAIDQAGASGPSDIHSLATWLPHKRPLRRVGVGEHLFYEGDYCDRLYILESGWVKLYRTPHDGQRQVVGFLNGGSILGLECNNGHANGCEAITVVTVRMLEMGELDDLCERDERLSARLFHQIGRQLCAAQSHLATVNSNSADQKLATFLLSFAEQCSASGAGDFELPMRRADMADFLGLSHETVSRKMTDFQRRGLIRMKSIYKCQIESRGMLEHIARPGAFGMSEL